MQVGRRALHTGTHAYSLGGRPTPEHLSSQVGSLILENCSHFMHQKPSFCKAKMMFETYRLGTLRWHFEFHTEVHVKLMRTAERFNNRYLQAIHVSIFVTPVSTF